MTGIYLKCDACGKTFGGEEVNTVRWSGLHPLQTQELKEAALNLGWTGQLTRESNNDKCPACSGKPLTDLKDRKCQRKDL